MSCLGSKKDRYESALVQRFLEVTYGSDAVRFILIERPDLQPSCGGRPPRDGGWPDFVYQEGQQVPNLVVELGRWNEGEKELWFEKRVESFGDKLTDQLRGRLPGFYTIRNSVEAYVGCIAGAALKDEYLGAMEVAGFGDIRVLGEAIVPVESLLNDPTAQTIIENSAITPEMARETANSVISAKVSAIKQN